MALTHALPIDDGDFPNPPQGSRGDKHIPGLNHLIKVNQLTSVLSAAHSIDELCESVSSGFACWMPEATVRLRLDEAERTGQAPPQETERDVLKRGKPYVVEGGLSAARDKGRTGKHDARPRSVMVLPLSASARVLGCLEITSMRPGHFSALHYHLSLLVASQLALALENILAKRQLTETTTRLLDQEKHLVELNERLHELAHTDDLTGLLNRRRLMAQLDYELARCRRYGGELSCLMIDIDGFKQVNDSWGHPAGDEVLRQLGGIFRNFSRVTDFSARYGGDEFMVLLPQTGGHGAACAAEKLRQKVQDHAFVIAFGRTLSLSVSVGCTTCANGEETDAAEVIARADNALYCAKRAGGNTVCCADSVSTGGSNICQVANPALTH